MIKYFLGLNVLSYAYYKLSPGHFQFSVKRGFQLDSESNLQAAINYHFLNLSLPSLLFNGAIFYTVGNYHLAKFGCSHFLRLLGVSALAGSLVSAYAVNNDPSFTAQGSMSLSAGLVAYNVMKNPQWFRYLLGPVGYLSLFALYGAFYNDRAALSELGAGWLLFVLGL
jgi:membrane associated rhomboid family serine protease